MYDLFIYDCYKPSVVPFAIHDFQQTVYARRTLLKRGACSRSRLLLITVRVGATSYLRLDIQSFLSYVHGICAYSLESVSLAYRCRPASRRAVAPRIKSCVSAQIESHIRIHLQRDAGNDLLVQDRGSLSFCLTTRHDPTMKDFTYEG